MCVFFCFEGCEGFDVLVLVVVVDDDDDDDASTEQTSLKCLVITEQGLVLGSLVPGRKAGGRKGRLGCTACG